MSKPISLKKQRYLKKYKREHASVQCYIPLAEMPRLEALRATLGLKGWTELMLAGATSLEVHP